MQTKTIIISLVIIAVGVVGFFVFSGAESSNDSSGAAAYEAVVYKSPSCGCCGVYASYLGNYSDYDVQTENVSDLNSVKSDFSIPKELESCHTMEIDGYVIEGHIPEAAIEKLLSQQPDIKGIGMGGMPAGSPGMPGPKTEDFVIYEITHEGKQGDIFMTL